MKRFLKYMYGIFPFKQPIFSVVRGLLRPGENVYKHLHFKGIIRVQIDDTHSFKVHHHGFEVENSLFWAGLDGGWERKSISLWLRLVKQSNVIFDIGANTGIYSLIAKSLNPDSQVYALEPISRVFDRLEDNVKLNDFDIKCIEAAASNFDGIATVYDTPTEHIYSVTVNKNLNDPGAEVIAVEIETMRLDTMVAKEGIQAPDLIKIDVETHEPEVLEGLGEFLDTHRPTLLIEILNDDVGRRVEQLVAGKGYLYFNLDETSGSVRRVDRITKSDYYNYLLCNGKIARDLGLQI